MSLDTRMLFSPKDLPSVPPDELKRITVATLKWLVRWNQTPFDRLTDQSLQNSFGDLKSLHRQYDNQDVVSALKIVTQLSPEQPNIADLIRITLWRLNVKNKRGTRSQQT